MSVAVNAVMLWGAHRILDWGWLPFLTPAWALVLPVLTASLVVAIVANVLFLGYDGVWLRAPANAVLAGFGIAVSVRLWQVFPFDLSGYAFTWDAVVRVLIVLSIVGSAIAIVVEVGRLARAAARAADEPPSGEPWPPSA
ncbi:MAG TPA: hypothetical protein VGC04_08400 [Cellulomonas sp.]